MTSARLHFLLILLIIPATLFCQDYDFSFMSGLRTHSSGMKNDKATYLFEMSGCRIGVLPVLGDISSQKTINNIRKKVGVNEKDLITTYSDEVLSIPNRVEVMRTPIEGSEVVVNDVLYYLRTTPDEAYVVYFSSLHPRDIEFERTFINEWTIDQFEDLLSDKFYADTVYVAGQMKVLGNACHFYNPHHITHRGAEVSWSEFSTLEDAARDKSLNIGRANNSRVTILAEEELNVIFNGVPTVATRVAYMFNDYMSRNPVIVYYIADEIDGHFISCTLSESGVNRNDYELSYLLEAFMSIPEIPYFAWNPFDYPMYEEYPETVVNRIKDTPHIMEMGACLWIPVGDLSHIAGPSPAIHMTLGLPIKQRFAIDLNMQAVFPLNKKEFAYHYDNTSEMTKATVFVQMGGRIRYHHKLNNNLYLSPYVGIGGGMIQTDLEDEKSTEANKTYRTAGALDLYGGLILRYKNVGFFMEYHHAKYSRSKHIERGFGSSALNIGVFYAISVAQL